MKKILIAIISMLILYSCQRSNIKIMQKWDNGTPRVTMDFTNIKDSTYILTDFFENGKIKSTQVYVNDKLNGKVINYSEKGFKEQEFDYVDGKKNGIGTAWYESGKIAFQFKFKNDLYYDGTEYFENGWPRVLVNFSEPGKREGNAYYFEEDGHMSMQGYFKNGQQDSIWTTFNKNGQIIERIRYKDGRKISN